jgi:hypothetical protein
VFGCK